MMNSYIAYVYSLELASDYFMSFPSPGSREDWRIFEVLNPAILKNLMTTYNVLGWSHLILKKLITNLELTLYCSYSVGSTASEFLIIGVMNLFSKA